MNTPNIQTAHQRIGEVLIARGQINDDQLRIALQRQKNDHKPLGEELLDLHFIGDQTMREAISEAAGYKAIDLNGFVANCSRSASIKAPATSKSPPPIQTTSWRAMPSHRC